MRKRAILLLLTVAMIISLVGCSNPKRDAIDTNIQQQMEQGTLDRS